MRPRTYTLETADTGTLAAGVFTTTAGGAFTGHTPAVTGQVKAVIFTDTDLDAGGDVTITTESTGQNIVIAANIGGSDFVKRPLAPTHDEADGSEILDTWDYVYLAGTDFDDGERIQVVIASGGNAKSGKFTFIVAD